MMTEKSVAVYESGERDFQAPFEAWQIKGD